MKSVTLFLSTLIVCITLYHPVHGKETITWLTTDFPPAWITQGRNQGQGGEDLLLDFLAEQLTNYRHERVVATMSRGVYILKNKDHVCATGTIRTPDREKSMHFTAIPSTFMTANGIIFKRNRHAQFNNQPLRLVDIIKNHELVFGIVHGRKYGGQLDEIVEKNKGKNWIYERAGADTSKGLLGMLLQDRLDYILGYDWELQYVVRQFWPKQIDKLAYLPVEESPSHIAAYTVCSKTVWGQEMIQRIETIILNNRHTNRYQRFWLRWISNQKLYQQLYQEYFLTIKP